MEYWMLRSATLDRSFSYNWVAIPFLCPSCEVAATARYALAYYVETD